MKKENTHKTKNTLYYPKQVLLFLLLFFFLNNCFSMFRLTPALEEDKSDLLKEDRYFILLNKDLTPMKNPDFTSLDKKVKSIANSKSFDDLNNLAIYYAKLSYIELSEKILRKLQIEKPQEIVPFLNLLRIYYVLDEYEIAKKMLKEFCKHQSENKNKMIEFMKELTTSNRTEEYVIFLDVISNYSEYEMQALEELGLYFLSVRDLNLAQIYFEKILTIYAFNTVALYSMMQIHSINESWSNVIIYGLPLKKEKKKDDGYYKLMAKAYFELGEYAKAIKVSEEAPDTVKSSLDFLIVWRDSILCNDIRASITSLNYYFQVAKKKNPLLDEKEFFFTSTNEGKQILLNLINGY